MVYAVLETGGKQHRVRTGERIRVEKLEVAPGETVSLDRVLAVLSDKGQASFGTPHLADTSVTATVIGHGKGPKIRMTKLRRRKNSRTRMGHRQSFTELQILDIRSPSIAASPEPTAAKAPQQRDATETESATAEAQQEDATQAEANATPAAAEPRQQDAAETESAAEAQQGDATESAEEEPGQDASSDGTEPARED